ncbi:MAG: LysM peptidoglycan-binding domain-containing protein [Methylococcaceae bacterium]|nr:LysM peptidoglycan-binding domain-containing protein [Methylococcaceae bacterium]
MGGKLEKIKIQAFKDKEYSGGSIGAYVARINPANYSHSYELGSAQDSPAVGSAGRTVKPVAPKPKTLSLKFYIDATGVIPEISSVLDEITAFRNIVYSFNGQIHAPNYLQLLWGELPPFRCRLSTLTIKYTLLTPGGTPLRAELDAAFQEFTSPKRIELDSGKNSPDLTHIRTVIAGDSLPLMCQRIYGDARYYLEVARVNQLEDFRRLEPGTQISFPPLKN